MPIDIINSLEFPRWKVYDRGSLDSIPQLKGLPAKLITSIRLATLVFPFKVNQYVLDNLIDWENIPDDPIFRLIFPLADMLDVDDQLRLQACVDGDIASDISANIVREIRHKLNPDPSDQSLNVPFFDAQPIEGLQHKYEETVLAFPMQAQTCHSYCSFCFRWPQFVSTSAAKHELKESEVLHQYLAANKSVTDLLVTGGDPLIMNSRRLANYLEPLISDRFSHLQTIRLGTKALTYWPHRFLSKDSDDLIRLFQKLRASGKHIAVMAHINHWRELQPRPVVAAIERLQDAGAVIRTQSPLLRGINDSAETWRRNWKEQVRLGMVPYYMFVERDTGASQYFGVPLAKALDIYQQAMPGLSGLGRTARGPVMSASPGKVHIVGLLELDGKKYFALNFIQARDRSWLNRLFLANFDEKATWLGQLRPADGSTEFFFQSDHRIAQF